MLELLTWAVGGILFVLSGMHLYWVFGGQKGAKAAIPSTGTDLLFKPSKIGTSIVAILLALAAWFVLELGESRTNSVFPFLLFLRCRLVVMFIYFTFYRRFQMGRVLQEKKRNGFCKMGYCALFAPLFSLGNSHFNDDAFAYGIA